MTGISNQGIRSFGLLIPVSVTTGEIDPAPVLYNTIHLLPVTYKIERDWQDGLIDGPLGMLEALIDTLTFEPYAVVEALVSPDTERFRRELAMHLPATIANALAAGEYPAPASREQQIAAGYLPGYDAVDVSGAFDPDEDEPYPGEEPAPRPVPRPRPQRAAPARPMRQDMPDANARLADAGPDESMGTAEQQRASDQAFADRRSPPDPLAEARDMVSDPSSPDVVQPQPQPQQPVPRAQPVPSGRGLPDRAPTARDPFVASTAEPDRRSVPIRQPTGPQQQPARQPAPSPGFVRAQPPQQGFERSAPRIDPRTGREAVYEPQNGYVPEMGAEGVSAVPGEPRADFGIGDVEP